MPVTWTIDHTAIEQARITLGIKHSVTIDTYVSWWYGKLTRPMHTILVSKLTPPVEVSQTIWHELGHALQIERDFGGDWDAYGAMVETEYRKARIMDGPRNGMWTKRYYAIPIECEAEDIAEAFGDVSLIH